MSKDELMAAFCECPSDQGDRQFTPCRPLAKGPRFINMVITFVLHPLSHYNSITKPRARFLLSFLEHLTIDFPSHFILSIIDVHLDAASHDKLIQMRQLQRMDARLNTLSTELYQVNILGRIARRQATMGGFAPEATPSPPSPMASDSEDVDDDDGDASSTDEMST